MCTIEALNPIAASGGARFFKRELFNCSIYKGVPRSASAHKLSCSGEECAKAGAIGLIRGLRPTRRDDVSFHLALQLGNTMRLDDEGPAQRVAFTFAGQWTRRSLCEKQCRSGHRAWRLA